MQAGDSESSVAPSSVAAFPATHWSMVLAVGHGSSPEADAALEKLCRAYWIPLYAFARRFGKPRVDAQDLTQAFFERLVESELVPRADSNRGKFRSFLTSFKNFKLSEHACATTQRRGGHQVNLSLDADEAEAALGLELDTGLSPEALYDRGWALATIEQAFSLMEAKFDRAGRGHVFEALLPFLQSEQGGPSYAQVAAPLGTTEGTIKVTVSRLRQRYRRLLRSVVAQTVANPAGIRASEPESHTLPTRARFSASSM